MSLPGDENPNPQWQLPKREPEWQPQWQSGSPLGDDAAEQPAPEWQQPPQAPQPGWVAPPRTPGQAYAALILGIVGLFPICPIILSIAGLVVGLGAKREIDRSGGQLGGAGIATAGIIISGVGIALYALFLVAVFAIGGAS